MGVAAKYAAGSITPGDVFDGAASADLDSALTKCGSLRKVTALR
jgi:hypothetical protein